MRTDRHTRAKVAVLVIAMIAIGTAGYLVHRKDGIESRFDFSEKEKQLIGLIQDPLPKPADVVDCGQHMPQLADMNFNGKCELSKNALPRIAFVGDSHTLHYKNAIWRNFSKEPVLMAVQTGCFPFTESSLRERSDCDKKASVMTEYLQHAQTIDTVVISGYWAYLMSAELESTGVNWRIPKAPDAADISSFKENATRFLSVLTSAGKRVVFMKDIPDLDFDIEACFDFRPLRLTKKIIRQDCSISRQEFMQRIQPYDAVLGDVLKQFPQVVVFDPRPLFCQGDRCQATDGELPYYFNGDHVNRHGAEMVIQALRREVKF